MLNNDYKTAYPQLQNKVVLNVDDNEMSQILLSRIMQNAGITTIQAENGAEAVKKMSEGLKPDLILMDLEMPVMNGVQTSEFIRKQIDAAVPIIINSATISVHEKFKLRRLGVYDFLEKPYTIKDVFSILTKVYTEFLAKSLA